MKKIPLAVVRWFFGISFALGSLVEFSESAFISGISALLLAALLIPPVSGLIFSKLNYLIPTWGKVISGIVLLFVMVGTASSSTSTEQTLEATPSPTPTPEVSESTPEPTPEVVTYEVVSVTDGDTFKVNIDGVTETVRLVGINTPETVDPRRPVECLGKEASDKLKAMLTGQRVSLQADTSQSDRDTFGRLLRFAFLNSTDVGLTLIQEGFAQESLYGSVPHQYRDAYVQAQQEAQGAKKGLWAEDACAALTITPTPTPSLIPVTTPAPSAATTPTTKPSTTTSGRSCSGPDLDCADFSTHSEAQLFFDGCGFTADNDPMRLDSVDVGDGVACESLP